MAIVFNKYKRWLSEFNAAFPNIKHGAASSVFGDGNLDDEALAEAVDSLLYDLENETLSWIQRTENNVAVQFITKVLLPIPESRRLDDRSELPVRLMAKTDA